MNIINEKIDDLNAVLKVKISKQDYEETVEKTLRDYRKKIHLPGFRAGMVPFGLVKKKFGTSVLQDEISKIVSKSVQNYLVDNKIKVVGQPLPKVIDNATDIDWQNQSEFEFLYEMGLAPEIDLNNIDKKLSVTEFAIKIDEKDVENALQNLRQYYASKETKNIVSDDNYIQGKCVQIFNENDSENVKDFNKEILFFINDIENNELKQKLLGKKINDKIRLNIPEEFNNNYAKIASAFNIEEEESRKINGNFEFEINSIYQMILPELKQDFFNTVCGKDKVNNKEGLMDMLKVDLKKQYENYSTKRFENDIIHSVLEKYKLKLPDGFLKKWLAVIDKENETNHEHDHKHEGHDHEIDNKYDKWSESMKWHLIQNKIIEENNLKPTITDIRNDIQNSLKNILFKNEKNNDDEMLKSYADNYLKDHKHTHQIEEKLINERTIVYLKSKFTIQTKEVTLNEFLKNKNF